MAIKDVAYVAAEFLVSRKRTLMASFCDIAGDVATLLTIGYGGYEVINHGFGLATILVVLAIAVGSLVGTALGVRFGSFLMDKFPSDEPSVEDHEKRIRALERGQAPSPAAVALTPEERQRLRAKDGDGLTMYERLRCDRCGGVHTMACPRVKKETRESSGAVSYEYFPWGEFPTEGIIWPEAAYTEDDE